MIKTIEVELLNDHAKCPFCGYINNKCSHTFLLRNECTHYSGIVCHSGLRFVSFEKEEDEKAD